MCDHLEAISTEEVNRQAIAAYAKSQAPVKMDVGVLAPPSAGAVLPHPDAPDPNASLDAFGHAKFYKCEGIGRRQAECTSKPGVELACNKCGGWGHHANGCPSKGEGKGKGKDGDKGRGKGGGKDWSKGSGGKDVGKKLQRLGRQRLGKRRRRQRKVGSD